MKYKNKIWSVSVIFSLILSSCATMQGDNSTSAIDVAVNNCLKTTALSTIGGAIAGAVIGNNTGSGNSGRGALIGAGVGAIGGAVACAFFINEANEIDKQRMKELEMAALQKDEIGTTDASMALHNGKNIDFRTTTNSVPINSYASVNGDELVYCREAHNSMKFQGEANYNTIGNKTLACKKKDGTWIQKPA